MKLAALITTAVLLAPLGSAATTSFLIPTGYTVTDLYPPDADTDNRPFAGQTILEVSRNGSGSIAVIASNGTHNLSWTQWVYEPPSHASLLAAIQDNKKATQEAKASLTASLAGQHNTTRDYLYDAVVAGDTATKEQVTKEASLTRQRIPADPAPAIDERLDQLAVQLQPQDPGPPWITWFLLVGGFAAVLVTQLPKRSPVRRDSFDTDDIILDSEE